MVDFKKVVIGLILLIVFIILIFQLVGTSSKELIDSADSVTDANNCSLAVASDPQGTLTYNISDKFCYNASTEPVYLAGQFDLPLNSLFGRSSVLLLIFMAVIFMVAIFTVIKGIKDKK